MQARLTLVSAGQHLANGLCYSHDVLVSVVFVYIPTAYAHTDLLILAAHGISPPTKLNIKLKIDIYSTTLLILY